MAGGDGSAGEEPAGRGEVFVDLQAVVDFFEQRPEYVAIMEGPELRIVAVNAALRKLLAGREVLGRPYFEAVSDIVGQGYVEVFGDVYRTGVPVQADEWEVHFRHPDGTNTVLWASFAIRPRLGGDGRVVGIWGESHDVTDQAMARRAVEAEVRALAAQFAQARAFIDTFQRALLPNRVPVLPTLDVAARYLLAADEHAAGGDWFDVVVRDGHALLVVGDVVGHGVEAAAAMGQLRAVLLDRLVTEPSVADAVAAVDRRAAREFGSFGATVCVVDVDLATGELVYVTAGHPPPLVLDGAGEGHGRYLAPTGARPLGAGDAGGAGTAVSALRDQLGDGEIVVLYTDGIVELPGRPPTQGTVELARDACRAASGELLPIDAPELAVERIASQVIRSLTRRDGYRDDITLLAAQRTERRPPLRLPLIADPDAATVAREALRGWLRPWGVGADALDTLLHVVTELVDNVADHAYARDGGRFEVTADLDDDGSVVVVVRDEGRWVARTAGGTAGAGGAAASEGRGLGLAVVRDLVDELEVDGGDRGTTVTVRHRLTRDAGVLEAGVRTPAPDEPPFEVRRGGPPPDGDEEASGEGGEGGGEVVVARGSIDARAVPRLRAQLAAVTAPGCPPATLDLRDATVLSSAAVHLLLRVVADAADLRIIAPPGTVAQHVLTLTGVPYSTAP
jgi:serine phosphatase RsbU (regulator of sigma subunit)/anti-sigma regulatory factor (Ser/Thr protein kinase)